MTDGDRDLYCTTEERLCCHCYEPFNVRAYSDMQFCSPQCEECHYYRKRPNCRKICEGDR